MKVWNDRPTTEDVGTTSSNEQVRPGFMEFMALGVGYRLERGHRELTRRERLGIRFDVYRGRPIAPGQWEFAAEIAYGMVQGDRVYSPRAYRAMMVGFGLVIVVSGLLFALVAEYLGAVASFALGVPIVVLGWLYPRLHERSTAVLAMHPDRTRERLVRLAAPSTAPLGTRIASGLANWIVATTGYWLLALAVLGGATPSFLFAAILGAGVVLGMNGLMFWHHRSVARSAG